MILRCPSGLALREWKLMLTSSKLLVLRVIRRSGIGLPRILHSARGEPDNHVGYFLVRHRLATHISTPVGRPQFGPSSDDNGAQLLIADQCQKGIICDVAALRAALALCAVARRAVSSIGNFALPSVAGGLRGIRGRIGSVEDSWPAPARPDFAGDQIDLLVRQHSAGALREGWH